MAAHHAKVTLMALLSLILIHSVYAWAPGECHADGATAARCCEHEAYWCHGGNARARNHCHYCQVECIKVSSTSVCVWGGTWPARYKKCYNGVEWFKVCSSIPNDASLGGGAWNHVDRQSVIEPISASSPAKGRELVPVKAVKAAKLESVTRQNRPNPLTNQIQFVISLMGQVLSALRSAVISNTIEAVKRNGERALEALRQLNTQVLELIAEFPESDRGLADIILDRFSDAILVLIARLEMALDAANTIQAAKEACQNIINQIGQTFWTQGEVALNAYAAFKRFTNDWAPWINAIRAWIAQA
ncbi:hypothetical protein FGB62_39g018 [Gracilaria domingensis]|nr:hypothetical protein FGB62_39g116 [Gracilaria domingensis]KAI0563471.1 hypothetical protein FGB62_39g09 [Gracilaria domingensis]KAI0563472.1 hypothetical protein FGB62_39g012 [Gracilaria domingensis]KAI0563479.1 hypothetical protein FGB62_39g015 [Gracilaria domingensis]KAI0563480.1 hypothetical protein FGB62_39g018 [Gracilaria domingensis]